MGETIQNADDPFAGIDPQMTEAPPAEPDKDDPFADAPRLSTHTTSGAGAFATHAVLGVVPTLTGMAAAGAGAETGGEIGAAIGSVFGPPGAAVGGLVGGFAGGVGGFFLGSEAGSSGQQWAVRQLPTQVQEATGISERAQRAQEAQHPYYAFFGGIAPYAMTMMPGAFTAKAANLPANATTFERLMANPLTSRAFGGVAMGGMELGQEEAQGESPDWTKIAVSTGLGVLFNKPTRLGESLTELGAQAPYTLLQPMRGAYVGAQMRWGSLRPDVPTVARAHDVGVMGPGTTEATFLGDQERSVPASATAHNAAADEEAVLGAPPTVDLDAIARRMEPELFARNDELLAQRDALRDFISDQSNPSDTAFDDLALKRSEIQAALTAANPKSPDAKRYRAQLKDLDAERDAMTARREAWAAGSVVDTPDVMLARQHLLDTEHALWDLGPGIAAARRRAADYGGAVEEEPAVEAPPAAEVAAPQQPTQAAAQESVPPVQPGFVRFYHGGDADPTTGGSRWVTTDPNYAANFRAEGGRKSVWYVDLPVGSPEEQSARDEVNEGIYHHVEMPEHVARQMRLFSSGDTAAAPPAEKSPQAQHDFIVADRTAQLVSAGVPRDQAEANARLEAAYYTTLAQRFGGALGTPEELYRARAARVVGPDGQPVPITRQVPTPTPARSVADIQAQDGVGARTAKTIQTEERAGRKPAPLADWIAHNRAEAVRVAQQLGLTDRIAELARSGKTAAEISKELGGRLTPDEIRAVRDNLGIAPAGPLGVMGGAVQISESERGAPTQPPAAYPWEAGERPRIPSNDEMRAAGIPVSRYKATQEEAIVRLAEWQAQQRATKKAAPRNPEIERVAQDVGVTVPEVAAPQEVFDEIVERAPEAKVLQDRVAALDAGETEYREAEREAKEAVPEFDPDAVYDADQDRPLEELEDEHRQADATPVAEQRPGGGGEPEPAAAREEPLPEGGEPPGVGGGPGGRAGPEGPAAGVAEPVAERAVEPVAEPAGATVAERPESEPAVAAAEPEPEPATGAAAPVERPKDGNGNPIFQKGERVRIGDGQALAGRHGTVESAEGLVMQPIFGGQRSEPTYHYTVRTDGGAVSHATKLEPEIGERPAAVPDVQYGMSHYTPEQMQRIVDNHVSSAAKYDRQAARARTDRTRQSAKVEAADQRRRGEEAQKALDQWKAANPEESTRIFGETAAPEGLKEIAQSEPIKSPPQESPNGGMIVETVHTRDKYPLFVVAGLPRVERDIYNRMVRSAKEGGGWYSTFKGHGAVPGFQFKTRAAAEAFLRQWGGGETAAETTPPPPPAAGRTEIGKNYIGQTLYEDERGVRSYVENGIRHTEPVQMRPGRINNPDGSYYTGTQVVVRSPAEKDAEFQVAEWHPTITGREPEYRPSTPGEVTEQAGQEHPEPVAAQEPAPETPAERAVADAIAPAEGKGPLPVTSEPPAPRVEATPEELRAIKERPTPPEPEGRPEPPPTAEPTAFGSTNKVFTADKAERARALLRAKRNQLRVGLDPEMVQAGIDLAGYYIEGGVRAFPEFAARMIQDIGEEFRPYIASWYDALRRNPDIDARGMSTHGEVDDELERWRTAQSQAAPAEPLGPQEAERLYHSYEGTTTLREIGQQIADGFTPAEIADSRIGDILTEPEIAALADQLHELGEIPEPTEIEEEDRGIQGTLPLRDEGTGAEDVQRAEALGENGPALAGEVGGGAPAAGGAAEEQAEGQARPVRAGGSEGGPGNRPTSTDRIPDTGEGSKSGATGRFADRPDARVEGENFSIEPGDLAEGRGPRQKARDNLAAIELTKRLIQEDRPATKAEQAILVKYTGWGGLKGAFEGSDRKFGKGFEAIGARLKELLTPEEYRRAAQSTQYAHYTAEHVVRSMWEAVHRMGFKGGLVFEPGMGVGHFLGLMPADLARASQYEGIERDNLTAQIAKLLYPESGVRQADYIRTPMPEGFFDLVIGNPPFADTKIVADPKYAARGFSLHDYFFAKSLDSVRPGGLLAFITSAHTMNNLGDEARNYLADRAEFVGGIRLPSSTFRQNANTEVTTDILFLRKRTEGEAAGSREWTETVRRTLPSEKFGPTEANVSRYFSEHPENVLGEEVWGEMQATGDYAVEQRPNTDLAEDLRWTVHQLPRDVMTEPPSPEERAKLDFASGQKKDGSFYIRDDGTLMQYRNGAGQEVKRRSTTGGGFTAAEHERIRHLIPMRDALRDVFAADLAKDDAAGAEARGRLNEHYDQFVDKFGPINKATFRYQRPTIGQQETARLEAREEARFIGEHFDDGDFDPGPMLAAKAKISEIAKARQAARDAAAAAGRKFNEGTFDPAEMPDNVYEQRPNIKPFMSDPESYRLRSIEEYSDETGASSKKKIFYENILKFDEEPELRSANDGVLWSMNSLGRFDLDAIAEKMGKDRTDIIEELGDSIYKVPGTRDTYQTKDEYLSGDIVSKLETARAEAETDPAVRRNIPALEAALPPPLPPSEISMLLGMPWIPISTVQDFVRDHLQLGEPAIGHSQITGTWYVNGGEAQPPGFHQWGTDDRNAFELLGDTMNRLPPKIYRWEGSGEDRHRVFDAVATQAAQDKVNALKQAFTDWVSADTERADGMAKLYNDALNRTVLRQYDGSYMTTPGVSSTWRWRPHQTRVVARIVQSGNTYMAHAVGAGKTSAMIGAGMEMRRLGLVRKPLYVVPNHMLGQFTKEFYEQYPTARIAVADEDRFHTDRRRQFVANVSQDDLDAVIMTHSSFGKLPVSDTFQEHLIQEQIEMLEEAISELSGDENRIARGRVENQKEKLEQKLSKAGKPDQDQTLTFEEMGADFLFVDEAHQFRKLSFATKQSGMKGISPEGSDMAWDLYSKVRYLDSQKPGRSVVFASGTPITNTMGELYSLSRFMQREALEKRGLSHFDSWAQTFGDTKTGLEETAAGTYQPVTRFGKFVNLPELYKMVGEVMDVVTPAQLEQYVVRPQLTGGQREFHLAPRTEILDRYQAELGSRMEAIKARKGPPQKGDDILLTVINDGRHAAIDPRFVEETQNDPRSKLNMMISNAVRIYHDTADHQFYDPASNYEKESFRGPATQMIFANLGVNGRGPMGFSTYQWIKEALRREGVAPEHIAFIGDYPGTIQRQALFNDMNEGKVRILIGSTQKMGTGVNAQRRLYALHNLDPLWYPADDEQRVGRILRQGNHNRQIEVHDYSTKGTYDSAMWKMMGNKARFIEQFFRGDPNLRDMEDIGEASMYEQASAMATTDERIITLTQLKQDLDKAQRQRAAHDREQYSLRQQLSNKLWEQDYYTKRAASIREDINRREDISGDNFSMMVGGEKFTKRKDAEEALRALTADRADGLGKGADTVIGKIAGFPIVMTRDTSGDVHFGIRRSDGDVAHVNARWAGGKAAHEKWAADYAKMDEKEKAKFTPPEERQPGATGIIASAEAMMRKFEQWEQDAKINVSEAARQEANIRPLIGKEFTGGDEIRRLANAVHDLEGQLKAEADAAAGKAPEGAAEEGPPPVQETEQGGELYQRMQGKIRIAPGEARSVITLARDSDASTFMHETAHDWLKQFLADSAHPLAPDQLRADAATVRRWLSRPDDWNGFLKNGRPDRAPQEKFARGFEQYLREGVAPSPGLTGVFQQFKAWLTTIYRTLRGLGAKISPDIREVFDRMLAVEQPRTVHSEVPERGPGIGAVHEADAVETEPHEAESVADRVVSERDRYIETQPPEVAHGIAAGQAEAGGPGGPAEPAAETGEGGGGGAALAPGGGQSEPVTSAGGGGTERGKVERGGSEAVSKSPGVAAGAAESRDANGQRGTGSATGPQQLAPRPAESFDDTGSDRLVDLAGNIRVENLTDVKDIAQAIHDAAERNDDFRTVRGGMTKGQMLDLADSMNLSPDRINEAQLGRMLGGTEQLGAKILAARRLVVQSAGVVSDLMKRAAETEADADVAALGVAIARHDMIQSFLAGVTAEWGRAGNAFHSLLTGWEKAQDVNQLLRDNLGRDLYQLKMIAKMGSRFDSPAKISKFVRDGKSRSFGRMILEYWINGLISGVSTHVTYSVGNSLLAAFKAGPETAIAAGLGLIRQQMGREGERVMPGEVLAQFQALFREAPAAAQAMIEAYRSGVTTLLPGEAQRPSMPFQGDQDLTLARNMTNELVTWRDAASDAYSLVQGMRDALVSTAELVTAGGDKTAPWLRTQYSPLGAIPDIQIRGVTIPVGSLARFPSRNVAAIHSLFRAMNYSMEINALAFREAASEGLSGTAFASRIAELRQNPTDEMMDKARGLATDLTLMGQAGRLTEKLSSLFNTTFNVPLLGETQLLKFVDPFIHIAGNIFNQALIKRSPIALLTMLSEKSELGRDLRGLNGNVAQDTAMARVLSGTMLAVVAGGLAAEGLASGSGPSDPAKAAMWRMAGNQPHSVRIGDVWYGVQRLGPLGMLLSTSADMYDVAHKMRTEDASVVGAALMHAFTQNILDESFMRGPADLIKATTDSGRYGAGYVRTMLSSFMPYSVLMSQTARATDPYSRQARSIMDAIKQRIPGLSEELMPRRDVWGEPMPSGDALIAAGVTAIYAQRMSHDPVNLAMLDIGIAPAPVERRIRNVLLSDEQYDDYARLAGRGAKMRLDAIVRSPDWQNWPRETKHDIIEEVLRQSREAARGIVMMKYPDIPREAVKQQMERRKGTPIEQPGG